MRLSELLERIRPAGAPGAASEGEQQHRRETSESELADVIAALQHPEQAGARLIAEAQEHAELLEAETNRTIAKQRAELPEQLAVQRATGSRIDDDDADAEHHRIVGQAHDEAARITQHATAGTPALVAVALDSIWSTVLSPSADSTPQ